VKGQEAKIHKEMEIESKKLGTSTRQSIKGKRFAEEKLIPNLIQLDVLDYTNQF